MKSKGRSELERITDDATLGVRSGASSGSVSLDQLSPEVIETLRSVGANYNNLEYDLMAGERGGRAGYLEHNLALLCGAEAATTG